MDKIIAWFRGIAMTMIKIIIIIIIIIIEHGQRSVQAATLTVN